MSVTTCPSCNSSVPPGAVFCDNCGYDLRSLGGPAQQPVHPTYQVSQPDGDLNCPSCGHINIAGSAFCENCGTQLVQPSPVIQPPPDQGQQPAGPPPAEPVPEQTPPAQPPTPQVVSPPTPPPVAHSPGFISGYFMIQEANTTLHIPQGKQTIIIGREDPVSGIFPDIDLDQFGGQDAGVGRRHAQMFLQAGQLLIEDLDSVNGTVVNKQKIPSRQPHLIRDGDEIRLGKMVLIYHLG